MASKKESGSEVHIGNVSGGIYGSIITGRDVSNATITIGGQPTSANKEPTIAELKQLLVEIQQELAEVNAQKEALQAISAVTPNLAMAAEQSVKEATTKVETEIKPEEAGTVQKSLSEATTLLGHILDGAKTIVEKADEVGRAAEPLVKKIEPLLEKLSVAAFWVAKLWLMR